MVNLLAKYQCLLLILAQYNPPNLSSVSAVSSDAITCSLIMDNDGDHDVLLLFSRWRDDYNLKSIYWSNSTLKVLATTIDALRHF